MLAFLKKLFRQKRKPPRHRGQVVTTQERLIPLVDFSRMGRRARQSLLELDRLDPRCRSVLRAMQGMTNEEIFGKRQRWSDPY